MPLKSTSANRGIGILIHGSKGFFDALDCFLVWPVLGFSISAAEPP